MCAMGQCLSLGWQTQKTARSDAGGHHSGMGILPMEFHGRDARATSTHGQRRSLKASLSAHN
jgi:hypothetical protein